MDNMWIVYLVRCSDSSLYCGITNNIRKRITTHNEGLGAKYTRARLPVKLVYTEKAINHSQALIRECEIKRMSKKQKEEMVSKIILKN